MFVSCAATVPQGKVSIAFADRIAGVEGLSERIFGFKVKDSGGNPLQLEMRGNGVFLFDSRNQTVNIGYELRLDRVLDPSQYVLVSNLGPQSSAFMLADLLPAICHGESGECDVNNVSLQIDPPAGWKIATTEKMQGNAYEIHDVKKAVIFLGAYRENVSNPGAMKIRIAVTGDWGFADDEIFKLADAIAREQAGIIGSEESGDYLVAVSPFPLPLTGLRSSGVTTGRTAILQLNPNDDARQTYSHFRRHLAHEMFHFYLPNAFRIRENFDWFWEGFTRYIALITLARIGQISLNEYLDAVGAEYEAYVYNPLRSQMSLIDASPDKFGNYANYELVYRKGMLVAALYDLELRRQSNHKYTIADVIRTLYRDYSRGKLEVGNREVLAELGKPADLKGMIRDDIEGSKQIDLPARIKPYGLVVNWGPATRGKVKISKDPRLSQRQKELLDGLARSGGER